MQLDQVIQSYKDIINTEKEKLDKLKSKIFQIGSIRLAVVLIGFFSIYYFWFSALPILISILACIVLFLFLLKYHNQLFHKKQYCELLIENADNELRAINYDFSPFDGAPEKEDGNHSYSLDLDLFGDHSFFQSVNRTITTYGKEALVDKFLYPSDNKENILANQSIIKELAEKSDLLNHFRAVGQMSRTEDLDIKNFAHQFENSKPLSKSIWKFAPFIPIALIVLFILFGNSLGIPTSFGGILYTLLFVASLVPFKVIKEKMSFFEKKLDTLKTYTEIFKIIENEKFESKELLDLQQKVKTKESASTAISQLQKHSNNLDQSLNLLGFVFLNPLVFWNVIYAIKIEKWVAENKKNIDQWFTAVAEFDSFVSLAIFAYNHPTYTYPKITDTQTFEAVELGHPMINREVCVTNDVSIANHPYFLVVTGANMAGKSTYLRTVGLNMTLANIGAPVFAKSLKFYPFHLVTNLRTSDSLADNESYFFAELKRLKMIIDRLQSGEQLFIILDEILKGTNSEDKQKGSIALMKQLIANKGCGIIATHDLILGNLEKEYPNEVKNYRFEADITNEELTFTYKIREGVAQNMNACFLMSKMGIVGLK